MFIVPDITYVMVNLILIHLPLLKSLDPIRRRIYTIDLTRLYIQINKINLNNSVFFSIIHTSNLQKNMSTVNRKYTEQLRTFIAGSTELLGQ